MLHIRRHLEGAPETQASPGSSLWLYPAENDSGRELPFMLVLPGGGYQHLAPHEGEPIAKWFNALGMHAGVLHYQLEPLDPEALIRDVADAIAWARTGDKAFRVNPNRIGMIGFSMRRSFGIDHGHDRLVQTRSPHPVVSGHHVRRNVHASRKPRAVSPSTPFARRHPKVLLRPPGNGRHAADVPVDNGKRRRRPRGEQPAVCRSFVQVRGSVRAARVRGRTPWTRAVRCESVLLKRGSNASKPGCGSIIL